MTHEPERPAAEPRPTTTCKLCFESIDARASVCRYCGHLQRGLIPWMSRHHLVISLCMGLFFAAMISFLGWTSWHLFDRGASFESYRGRLTVTSSKMTLVDGSYGPVVAVVGTVRNDTPLAWKDLQFEVRFMNDSDELIDVGREVAFHDDPGLPAGAEDPFRIVVRRDFRFREPWFFCFQRLDGVIVNGRFLIGQEFRFRCFRNGLSRLQFLILRFGQ